MRKIIILSFALLVTSCCIKHPIKGWEKESRWIYHNIECNGYMAMNHQTNSRLPMSKLIFEKKLPVSEKAYKKIEEHDLMHPAIFSKEALELNGVIDSNKLNCLVLVNKYCHNGAALETNFLMEKLLPKYNLFFFDIGLEKDIKARVDLAVKLYGKFDLFVVKIHGSRHHLQISEEEDWNMYEVARQLNGLDIHFNVNAEGLLVACFGAKGGPEKINFCNLFAYYLKIPFYGGDRSQHLNDIILKDSGRIDKIIFGYEAKKNFWQTIIGAGGTIKKFESVPIDGSSFKQYIFPTVD